MDPPDIAHNNRATHSRKVTPETASTAPGHSTVFKALKLLDGHKALNAKRFNAVRAAAEVSYGKVNTLKPKLETAEGSANRAPLDTALSGQESEYHSLMDARTAELALETALRRTTKALHDDEPAPQPAFLAVLLRTTRATSAVTTPTLPLG